MKNRYEEAVARFHETIEPLENMIEEIAATTPPQPRAQLRRVRKMTPAVIRRNIAGLRAGTMRPIDPNQDPIALADKLEEQLELILFLERLAPQVERAAITISTMIENENARMMEWAMEVYRRAREMARTSDDELLKEHVMRMGRALGRGERRS
jgi:hypothetical protein